MTKTSDNALKPHTKYDKKTMFIFVLLFATIGAATLLLTRAAVTQPTVDSTLPNPTNVRAYGDDRVATVMWDPPANAASKGIVGFYVTWGEQSTGVYTTAKQTTYLITQIQPLTNGKVYNVKVQSVQGSRVMVDTPNYSDDQGNSGQAEEFRANGKVSSGATVSVTPSSARVDDLRNKMTGFFDDFNTPAGAFDELKWNHATSNCADLNSAGAFINTQFHAHNQVRSGCDRSQIISRPRNVFDITGRTEADPGVIVMDFDGVTHGRDVWYLDLIPTTVRKNGMPIDVTSHPDSSDGAQSDPTMLRFTQHFDKGFWISYNNNKSPERISHIFGCPWGNVTDPNSTGENLVEFGGCNITKPIAGLSPIPEPLLPTTSSFETRYNPVPNVREHWRWEISPTKLKVFINGTKVLEDAMPATFANTKKFLLHSNIFSYNTGKGDEGHPTTSMMHWDNFGFNGPAPATVTHSYMEGGTTGNTPYLGPGITGGAVPYAPRSTKIKTPDPIGSPTQVRLMFTLGNFGPGNYVWDAGQNIVVNGKKINYPNPTTASMQPPILQSYYGPLIAEPYVPYSDSIILNAADLKQGVNDITFNMDSEYLAVFNVHIEFDYAKGTEPAYTSPTAIFGAANLQKFIEPPLTTHDAWLFVEQDMGLPTGTLTTTPPAPPAPPSPPPTPTPPPSPPPTTPPGKVGDINGDGSVGIADLAILLGNYNKTVTINTNGDLNSSSNVTTADLAILLGNYGK